MGQKRRTRSTAPAADSGSDSDDAPEAVYMSSARDTAAKRRRAEELGRRVEAFWAERQEVMLACRQLYDADVLIYELDGDKDKDEEVRIIQDLRVESRVFD